MVSYEPAFTMMNEWYKQLFGESEGKDNKGIYPSSAIFSTDLHSMGQFIQEGSRILFETVVDIKKPQQDLYIEADPANFDGLNFLSQQNMSVVNQKQCRELSLHIPRAVYQTWYWNCLSLTKKNLVI